MTGWVVHDKKTALVLFLVAALFSAKTSADESHMLAGMIVRGMTREQQLCALKGLAESLFGPVINLAKIYMQAGSLHARVIGAKPTEEELLKEKLREREERRQRGRVAAERLKEKLREIDEHAKEKARHRREQLRKKYPDWMWGLIDNRIVFIGMIREPAKLAWGPPKSINTTITRYGVNEQWVYSGYRYLYFENGRLTAIQKPGDGDIGTHSGW